MSSPGPRDGAPIRGGPDRPTVDPHVLVGAHRDVVVGTPRVGARMILLDPDDRVLLIEEAGREDGVDWHHWLTPGGGVEPGESLAAAATREVIEETGLRVQLPRDARVVHTEGRRWSWQGQTYDQLDHLFAARVGESFDVRPSALTPMEQQTVVGARWWSVAELAATTTALLPAELGRIVADLIERGEPARPTRRTAGRVLVLDPESRVLLIKSRWGPDGSDTNWVAPGGGLEAGETLAQAAQRELFEETGIVADLANSVTATVERAVFSIGDVVLDQSDHYFVWPVRHQPAIDRTGLTELERRTVLEYRWWSALELSVTDEVFWPADLAQVVDDLAGSPATATPAGPGFMPARPVADRA